LPIHSFLSLLLLYDFLSHDKPFSSLLLPLVITSTSLLITVSIPACCFILFDACSLIFLNLRGCLYKYSRCSTMASTSSRGASIPVSLCVMNSGIPPIALVTGTNPLLIASPRETPWESCREGPRYIP